jgi:FdhE protein
MSAPLSVDPIKRRRPEWSPWLAVVDEVLLEAGTPRWDETVPAARRAGNDSAPLLDAATVQVDGTLVRRLLDRLTGAAAQGGSPKMATLKPALRGDVDLAALFRASIGQPGGALADVAAGTGADVEALQAVVALLAVPFLQACNRRWASAVPGTWLEGYCPVCGSWPALGEVRGIERSRYLRCGRCGGEWHAHILRCAYCRTGNHEELATLVPEKQPGSAGSIEACRRCRGYVKVFTRLQGCAPAAVMLDDLDSVDLDVAAIEQGYTRPAGAGYAIDVTVGVTPAARRFFGWNA